MPLIVFNDLTQEQFDTAEQLVITQIRAAYPQLDLRAGTVLREQLVRPGAELHALDAARMDDIAADISLANLAAQTNPDETAVNAVLSNFNMTLNSGHIAYGTLLVRVDANRVYTLAANTQFSTLSGLAYAITGNVTVKTGANTSAGEIELRTADGVSYYFLLPVQSTGSGSQYNISANTALDPVNALYGYVSSVAYADFTGGLDSESVSDAVAAIPAALSHRSITDRTAIDARLRAEFNTTDVRIQAISVQGMGDTMQRRDKHNLMGAATGSRIDTWIRTFTDPTTTVLLKTGTRISANTYQITIDVSDAPGYAAVRSVCEVDSVAVASYPVIADVRAAGSTGGHDIVLTRSPVDVVGTIYQTGVIVVTGVPYSTAQHDFKVELYTAPGLVQLQAYVDDRNIASLNADCLVRCPLLCLVDVSGTVYQSSGSALSLTTLQSMVANYINSRSFVTRLTRSEIANVLLGAGVTRIDLSDRGLRIAGAVRDALGVQRTLSGDSIDISTVYDAAALLGPETVVFCVAPGSVNLTLVTE